MGYYLCKRIKLEYTRIGFTACSITQRCTAMVVVLQSAHCSQTWPAPVSHFTHYYAELLGWLTTMGSRDEELKRLINYAKGHGLKVTMIPAKRGDPAALWLLDGSGIEIYYRANESKTNIILSFIHELGHHLWFVREKKRKPDLKYEDAIDRCWDMYDKGKILGKRYRRKILSAERAGTKWWTKVYEDTGLKFPIWKLHLAMEFDIWQYEVYYETGRDPDRQQKNAKRKELLSKYAGT